ncbi:hypothetical protein WH87_08930 [Devosia epidermidihirudinis]|uniref:Arylamine N-acetyltransferase n=1 Tax=Devosia epidermidihirudinis TaxID=1293439 RepID=A0A0F5QAP8_9HYPH|nr:arylamine N-acetyltransferase [Devosia epidermidihirudinis]KKC37808.1 hypothetical protein WH87_08930 [Devosia epidermidihirudinis]
MSQKVNLNAYFERIGFAGSIAPTLATLEQLHALHPAAIAFEDLDPVMGRPVRLDQASLEQKLLHNQRGGYCFEQNTLFMNILRDLDFTVRAYGARTLWGHPEGAERMISHMVLVVDIAGTSYLCDVGFGTFTLLAPLKLRADSEQTIGQETYRITRNGEGFRLDVKLNETWHAVYQFDLIEHDAAAIAALSTYVETVYHERALLFVSRGDKEGRYNLSGNRLTIHRPGVERERRYATSVEELKAILSETFRIALPPAQELDPALQRVLDAQPVEAS